MAVLMRSTLASPERNVCAGNLANAGATEIQNAAEQAIRYLDRPLGAAVLARIDSLPDATRKSLTITKADVAEPLVEEEFQGAVELLALSEWSLLVAGYDGREALGQTLSTRDTLARGTKRGEVEAEIGRELAEADLSFKPVVAGVSATKDKIKADAEKSEAMKRAEAMSEWNAAYMADEHDKAREINAKWGFGMYEDEGTNEGTNDGTD